MLDQVSSGYNRLEFVGSGWSGYVWLNQVKSG